MVFVDGGNTLGGMAMGFPLDVPRRQRHCLELGTLIPFWMVSISTLACLFILVFIIFIYIYIYGAITVDTWPSDNNRWISIFVDVFVGIYITFVGALITCTRYQFIPI